MSNYNSESTYRRLANDAVKMAQKWEDMAKDQKKKGNKYLAIIAAQRGRKNRVEARECSEKADKLMYERRNKEN